MQLLMLKTPRWPHQHSLGLDEKFGSNLEATSELLPDYADSHSVFDVHNIIDANRIVQGTARAVTFAFSVLMEDPVTEKREKSLVGKTTYFGVRVICHERPVYKERYFGCKEYTWRVRKRYSEFEALDNRLRASLVLPPSVVMPKKGNFWSLLSNDDAAKAAQRSEDLHRYLSEVLEALQTAVSKEPGLYRDSTEVCAALPKFLGMQEAFDLDSAGWAPPKYAEERHAALVHSLDRGIYVWGHSSPGSPRTRLTRFDRQAYLGDLLATYAEARRPVVATVSPAPQPCPASPEDGKMTPWRIRPSVTSPPFTFNSSSPSLLSSPSATRLPTPVSSPGNSRCPSPPPHQMQQPRCRRLQQHDPLLHQHEHGGYRAAITLRASSAGEDRRSSLGRG